MLLAFQTTDALTKMSPLPGTIELFVAMTTLLVASCVCSVVLTMCEPDGAGPMPFQIV